MSSRDIYRGWNPICVFQSIAHCLAAVDRSIYPLEHTVRISRKQLLGREVWSSFKRGRGFTVGAGLKGQAVRRVEHTARISRKSVVG